MAWSDKQLLDYDPELGRTEWYYYDPDEHRMAIETEWDVSGIVEDAKASFNQVDERASWKGDLHHVAHIPFAILQEYRGRGIDLLRDKKELRKFLNDPDNRFFRTRPGRV